MDLFVYSDESGVFDKEHNEIYVYGGLIFLGKQQKDVFTRKYIVAERSIRRGKYAKDEELKACKISNSEKGKLYRSMNGAARFGVIINQRNVLGRIGEYIFNNIAIGRGDYERACACPLIFLKKIKDKC